MFDLSLYLLPHFVHVSRKGSGESALLRRLSNSADSPEPFLLEYAISNKSHVLAQITIMFLLFLFTLGPLFSSKLNDKHDI